VLGETRELLAPWVLAQLGLPFLLDHLYEALAQFQDVEVASPLSVEQVAPQLSPPGDCRYFGEEAQPSLAGETSWRSLLD